MKPLDIYYFIDLDETQDHTYIQKCLKIYINTKYRDYNINKFEKYETDFSTKEKSDIIKNGILMFNDMFFKLKLKVAYDVWFFYISNGNIGDKYKDVSLILLNKKPMIKKTNYVINKKKVDLNINYIKEEKLKNIKNFSNALDHLFNSNKVIEYN